MPFNHSTTNTQPLALPTPSQSSISFSNNTSSNYDKFDLVDPK